MYDEVIVGQGLTGLLSAIWSREQGKRVALVSSGSGKILQATGVMDVIPGQDGKFVDLMSKYQLNAFSRLNINEAVKNYLQLTKRIGYPYHGNVEAPITIVTGSGHLKKTALYPETIMPVPEEGHVVIVGFEELVDFLPNYIKGNLQKDRPKLKIDTVTVSLGKSSTRTMSQLDAARLLDQDDVCQEVLDQMKIKMGNEQLAKPDLFIFPSSLGLKNWRGVLYQLTQGLKTAVTEAPGMPPNATAIRLHENLKQEAIKLGVRFYENTTVIGSRIEDNKVKALKTGNGTELKANYYVLATGGVLGGGLEKIADGFKDKVLGMDVNEFGHYRRCPGNVFLVGASQGTQVTQYGITGGVFSILSSYESLLALKRQIKLGGLQHA